MLLRRITQLARRDERALIEIAADGTDVVLAVRYKRRGINFGGDAAPHPSLAMANQAETALIARLAAKGFRPIGEALSARAA